MPSLPSFDLYRELEVDPAATAETIDAAWKSLLKRHHPDVSKDPAAAHERVKRLNLAHDWLSNPGKRTQYDRSRRRPGVIVVPRPEWPADPLPTRPTHTVPTQPSRAAAPARSTEADSGAAHGTARPGERRISVETNGRGHNPYAEFQRGSRPVGGSPPAATEPRPSRARHFAPLVAPLALASVLILVAMSQFLSSARSPTIAAVAGSTSAPTQPLGSPSTQIGALASIVSGNPRSRPLPDLAAAVPSTCRGTAVQNAFSFEIEVRGGPAKVYVVRCDAGHAFGPLVYVPGNSAWQLLAKGRLADALPYRGFSGGISGESPDEFGIAWTRSDPKHSTVTLYRIGSDVEPYWDSSTIGLQWALARYSYLAPQASTAAGSVAVVFADLATGTRNCATCSDHQLYRDVYDWGKIAGRGTLVLRGDHEPAGVGLP